MNPHEEALALGEILSGAPVDAYSLDDFRIPRNRQIYQRMVDLYERGEVVDRVLLANELMLSGELIDCGGLSYLVELDDYRNRYYDRLLHPQGPFEAQVIDDGNVEIFFNGQLLTTMTAREAIRNATAIIDAVLAACQEEKGLSKPGNSSV